MNTRWEHTGTFYVVLRGCSAFCLLTSLLFGINMQVKQKMLEKKALYMLKMTFTLARDNPEFSSVSIYFPRTCIVACLSPCVIKKSGLCCFFFFQCGQGSTDDELSPTCVSSLLGISLEGVAAGLWHTVCISTDGDVYSFGGNQFGQLGTGADQAEVWKRHLYICIIYTVAEILIWDNGVSS